jgi:hypothetical protein
MKDLDGLIGRLGRWPAVRAPVKRVHHMAAGNLELRGYGRAMITRVDGRNAAAQQLRGTERREHDELEGSNCGRTLNHVSPLQK